MSNRATAKTGRKAELSAEAMRREFRRLADPEIAAHIAMLRYAIEKFPEAERKAWLHGAV